MTEVRVKSAQQRSVARRAHALGFTCIWSCPPPPSETFECPPGGVCILAKESLCLRKVCNHEIDAWDKRGRAVCGNIVCGSQKMLLVCLYFPNSHPDCKLNECLLTQVGSWIAGMTCPAILGSDLNTTLSESAYLALSPSNWIWQVADNKPTTKTKKGEIASSLAIDHIFTNARGLDLGPKAWADHDVSISDHFPVAGHLWTQTEEEQQTWRWPKRMHIDGKPKTTTHGHSMGTLSQNGMNTRPDGSHNDLRPNPCPKTSSQRVLLITHAYPHASHLCPILTCTKADWIIEA